MATQRLAKVVITANASTAKKVLEEIDALVQKYTADIQKMTAAGQANTAECKKAESTLKALSQVQRDNIEDTKRLGEVVQDLANTKLRDLRRALGSGKSALSKLTGSDDDLKRAEQIRAEMKLVGDEIRLIEGQYVNIAEGQKNVSNQSDQWLDKALKQQRDLVGSLQKSDASYQQNLATLKQLEAEEDRRKGKMGKQEAISTASNQSANASDLRRAKATITEVRDKTESHKVGEIEKYNKALQEIDKRLNSISGQFVDIQKGIGDVSNQSDQWLDKAIKQQRDLVGSLQKSDASYQQNLDTLKQLEAEEDRRKGKMSITEARQTVTSQNASASDLRRAKTTLTDARDNTPTGNSADIARYNSELQEIEKRLEAVSGKTQKAAMSWKEMRQVLSAPNKASGEDIKRTMEVIQQKIQQLPAGSKYVAALRRQYTMLEQTLKGTRMSQSALNDVLTRSKQGKASLDELRRAYKQLEEELNQVNTKSKEFADKQKSMKELKKNIDEVTGAANKQGNAWQTAMKNLTAYVGMFAVFNQVKSMMTGVIKKNLEYSGSLTDIRKVSGLAQEDINALSKELAKIDTRTSVDGLAQLAFQGAKLGMSKYGVEGMAQFVRAADQINVAIGEEMGEEALPALSKMVEVMGLIPRMGIEKAMLATGSAMFKLSTTSTSTSNDIVEFAKRLTGVARTAGITTDQLLALGSASSSMMLMPEVASTALGKFIVALQKNHNLIAKELDIPDETIKNLYASGRVMDAIVLVLEKMKQKGNMNALGDIFKDLGSDGQRLITAMVTMSKNVDMLKDHLDTANDAFHEATAVTAEYEMQQESAIGILERANNLWEKAFVNPDGVDNVKELSRSWYEMSKFLTENVFALNSMKAVLWLVITACKALVYILPALMAGLLFRGAVGAIIGIKTALVGMKDMAILATLRTEGLRAAWSKLNLTMKANWISLLIGLLVELGVALTHVFNRQKDVAEEQLDINKYVREGAAEYDKERRKIDSYIAALNNANTSAKQRERIIKNFNREYKPYLDKLGLEVNSVDTLKKAYSKLNDELRKKMFYQIKQKAYDTELGKSEGEVGKAIMDYTEYINSDKGATWAAYDTKYIQDLVTKGKGAQDIYRSMVESQFGKTGTWSNYDGSYMLRTGSVKDDRLLHRIENIVSSQEKYNKTKKTIDDALDGLIGDYDPYAVEPPGTLDKDADDKDAKRKAEQEKREREEKNRAKNRANALIANIKAFYEEQMRKYLEWVTQMNADGEKISEGQQKEQMDYLQSRMDLALGKARQSIATLDNGWKKFFQYMDEDVMVYDDETSKQLLESIGKADVSELHELFTKLSGDISRENNKTLAENLGALLDQIFANGSKELREAAEKLLARQREIQKILNEHDYTGAVDRNTRSEFDRLGFLQPAKDIRSDSPEGLEKMNAAFDKLTTKARESITVLYSINPESENFQSQFLDFLSVANEGFDFSKLKAQDLKALYLELIKYNKEYDAANKKEDDERKKLNDYGWSKTDFYKGYNLLQPKLEQDVSIKGSYRNAGQRMGMESVSATDPELELMKARMEFAQQYYAFLEEHNATEQQLADARKGIMSSQANYAKKLTGDMFEQYNSLLTFMGPLQTFGESVGEAFATMTENAAEGRKALKTALKQMIKSFATNTLQMISQQQIDRAQTTAHYTQLLLMQQAFAQAQLQAEVANGVAMIGAQQATHLTEEQLEGIHQQVMAALRSAGIFGWCVSTLGPIAGPIAYSAMMAILMGLLNFAISKIGGGDKANNNVGNAGNGKNTKIVSGMLTYDSGNVQDLRPFVGNDGSLYWATEDNKPHDGVSLLTQPTATTINGQPSLVAENGPELVIGRETTQAMMMNNPQLLKALVNYDRNYSGRRAYDAGNIAEASPTIATGASASEDAIAHQATTNIALLQAVNTLLQRLEQPIEAKIDMYGRGKLYDSMTKANQFMKNK